MHLAYGQSKPTVNVTPIPQVGVAGAAYNFLQGDQSNLFVENALIIGPSNVRVLSLGITKRT